MSFTGGVGKLLHWVGYFLVFGFTATCTYMLFASITPPGLWWIPVLALGFIEYGALKWKTYHKQVAEGVLQYVISLALLFVCIVAIVGTTALEVTKWFAGAGYLQTMPWIITLTVYYLVFTIAVNVLAYMTIDLIHPSHMAKLSSFGQSSLPATRVVEAKQSLPQQQPARATHMLPNGDEIAVYGPNQQIAQQKLNEEVQQMQPATGQLKQTFTREEVQTMIAESSDRAYQAGVKYSQPPLPGPQLVPGSHEGNQNGNK